VEHCTCLLFGLKGHIVQKHDIFAMALVLPSDKFSQTIGSPKQQELPLSATQETITG
jgi:hypothetical protein